MKIINTFIVCEVNPHNRLNTFFKVHQIQVTSNSVRYILEDNGFMTPITKTRFEELKNNINELGL
jgi:hypothetical protein